MNDKRPLIRVSKFGSDEINVLAFHPPHTYLPPGSNPYRKVYEQHEWQFTHLYGYSFWTFESENGTTFHVLQDDVPVWLRDVDLHEFSSGFDDARHRLDLNRYGVCGVLAARALKRCCIRRLGHDGDHSAVPSTAQRMDRYDDTTP